MNELPQVQSWFTHPDAARKFRDLCVSLGYEATWKEGECFVFGPMKTPNELLTEYYERNKKANPKP